MDRLIGTIDRIEGELAVILFDQGGEFVIHTDYLPEGWHEGAVVNIKLELDDKEEKRRLDEVAKLQEKLIKRTQEKEKNK